MAASSQTCYPGAVTNLHHAVEYEFSVTGAGTPTTAPTGNVGSSKVCSAIGHSATGKYEFTLRNKGTFVGASGEVINAASTPVARKVCFAYDAATGILLAWVYDLATPTLTEVATGDLLSIKVKFVDSPNGT